jgi:hypothetical protein
MAGLAEARRPVPYRGAFAIALLVVLAVCLASFQRGSEAARRWVLLERSMSGKAAAPAQGSRFWFDPDYAAFLDAVAAKVAPGATVAVRVPSWPDTYLYLAVYGLAPRRVVDARWIEEAAAVAVYKTEAARDPVGEPIPNGTLRTR